MFEVGLLVGFARNGLKAQREESPGWSPGCKFCRDLRPEREEEFGSLVTIQADDHQPANNVDRVPFSDDPPVISKDRHDRVDSNEVRVVEFDKQQDQEITLRYRPRNSEQRPEG